MKIRYAYVYIICCLLFTTASSAVSVADIQAYLNSFKTLKGDFEQESNGSNVSGHFAIQKPGKIHLEYPHQTIYSHNDTLYIYDKSSGDRNQMDLNQSLAEFLLRSHIDFDHEGITIKRFKELAHTVELVLQKEGSEDIGELTLVFQRDPLDLIQWIILDTQGQRTVVDVYNLKKK